MPVPAKPGELVVRRGRPQDADDIARFITNATHGKRRMTRNDVMAAFGEKAYLLIERDSHLAGVAGWQVENLVARTVDVFLDDDLPLVKSMRVLIEEVEKASRELHCEASLLFVSPKFAQHRSVWDQLGYEEKTVEDLGVRAWQEAAQESMPDGSVMLFKRLREDRIYVQCNVNEFPV